MFVAGPFEFFPYSMYVWYHHGDVFVLFLVGVVPVVVVGLLSFCLVVFPVVVFEFKLVL